MEHGISNQEIMLYLATKRSLMMNALRYSFEKVSREFPVVNTQQ